MDNKMLVSSLKSHLNPKVASAEREKINSGAYRIRNRTINLYLAEILSWGGEGLGVLLEEEEVRRGNQNWFEGEVGIPNVERGRRLI